MSVLDLAQPNGAVWFAARCNSNAHRRVFATLQPRNLWQLLAKMYATQPALLDTVVVHLATSAICNAFVAPEIAAGDALRRILFVIGTSSEQQQLLRSAVRQRYAPEMMPSILLVTALFQHLQLPFVHGVFAWNYPTPLHRYPRLECGHVYRMRGNWVWAHSSPYQHFEANVTVWLNILRVCNYQWLYQLYRRIGPLHRCIVEQHICTWHWRSSDAIRRCTNNVMSLYLRCSETIN